PCHRSLAGLPRSAPGLALPSNLLPIFLFYLGRVRVSPCSKASQPLPGPCASRPRGLALARTPWPVVFVPPTNLLKLNGSGQFQSLFAIEDQRFSSCWSRS